MTKTASTNRSNCAYEELRDGILTGRWEADERLSTYRLAEQLGMSRTPIIEALKRLEADGLIEIVPQVGCRVVGGAEGIDETFLMRGALEALAAEAAAARIATDELDVLALACDECERAHEAHDPDRYHEANRAFHQQIVRSSGLTHLERLVEGLWTLNRCQLKACGYAEHAMAPATSEHRAILEALAAGDAAAARAATEEHLRRLARDYRAHAQDPAPVI